MLLLTTLPSSCTSKNARGTHILNADEHMLRIETNVPTITKRTGWFVSDELMIEMLTKIQKLKNEVEDFKNAPTGMLLWPRPANMRAISYTADIERSAG